MKVSQMFKMTRTLILGLLLTISIFLTSPSVTFAADISTDDAELALDALKSGNEARESGNNDVAADFYQEAIDLVKSSSIVDIMIASYYNLADVTGNPGDAARLRKLAKAGDDFLDIKSGPGSACGECNASGNGPNDGEWRRKDTPSQYCKRCN